MQYEIGVMDGDDIGLEVVPEAVGVMSAAAEAEGGLNLEFHHLPVGWQAYMEYGSALPDGTVESLEEMHGLVLGPIGHAAYPRDRPGLFNAHPLLRRRFDLFANLRPARSYATVPAVHEGVDLVVVRENNEGFQPDRNMVAGGGEFQPTQDTALSVRVITRRQSERVARTAFETARQRDGKKRVTAIHKQTVFELTDGLFMETVREVAQEYPDVTLDDYQVDTFSMHAVMKPQQFDVVLCTNMFGDILSDQCAGLVGGLGMAPGLNVGDRQAMAQATHGSAPDIAGKGIANPYAMIMSSKMLLEWLGIRHGDGRLLSAGRRIERAAELVFATPGNLPVDLGGGASTRQIGAAISEACSEAEVTEDLGS